MNKTITLIIGGIITITLSIFLILGEIDLYTFGTLATAILGVVYGFYQKVENKELIETNLTLEDNQYSYKYTIKKLIESNKQLSNINNSLKRDLQINDEKYKVNQTKVVKPEIVEVLKEKVFKKSKSK